jgi:hypothetical protein
VNLPALKRPSVLDAITAAQQAYEVTTSRRLCGITIASDDFDELVRELVRSWMEVADVAEQVASVERERRMGIERRIEVGGLLIHEERLVRRNTKERA